MARVTVKVEGLKELGENLAQLKAEVRGQIVTDALKAAGKVVEQEAKQRAPVLDKASPYRTPGAMRRAITSYAIRWNQVIVRVRNRGWVFDSSRKNQKPDNPVWWWLVEFGTSKMRARPFLRPAFESRKFEALTVIRDKLRQGLDNFAKGLHVQRRRTRGGWR